MLTHELIQFKLDHGEEVMVTRGGGGGGYEFFIPKKDGNGNYRCSYWYKTEQECLGSGGGFCGYTKEEMEEISKKNNWQIVWSRFPKAPDVPVGTRVEIIDDGSCRCGEIGTIKTVGTGYFVKIDNEEWIFDRHQFTVLPPDDLTIKVTPEALKQIKEAGIKFE